MSAREQVLLARGGGGGLSRASARGVSVYVSDVQRARVLSSAVAVIAEYGYGQMSVARITGRARVSRRTFYDLFKDREDCFLAAFEEAVGQVAQGVCVAFEGEARWCDRVRAGLTALLEFLEREPAVCSLVVVDALGAGASVLGYRARLLDAVKAVVDEGRLEGRGRRELPPLTADGVVGAVFSVIHARVLQQRPASLLDLRNALMAMIVLPYLGQAAAAKELQRPVPRAKRTTPGVGSGAWAKDPLEGLSMRFTYRTLRTLEVIGESPGASNRVIADTAGVADQGQMSKLLARLEGLGLIKNLGEGQPSGEPNAWRLTPRGQQIQQATGVQSSRGGPDNRGADPSNTTRGNHR